jgi:hypothetical protein
VNTQGAEYLYCPANDRSIHNEPSSEGARRTR